ncbi:MAG TPA: glycosyl hydrolase 108 family protein [Microvirga sp.]
MTRSRFSDALAFVLAEEGGSVDHPRDPGGPTRHGVTQGTLARWRGRPVSREEVWALGPADVEPIYRALYWDAVAGDALPPGLDLAVFDTSVHAGPRRALRLLQQALGVPEDGRMGPITTAAAASDPPAAIRALLARRLAHLKTLPGWPTFGRGWSRRLRRLEQAALARATPTRLAIAGGSSQQAAPGRATLDQPTTTGEVSMLDTKSILASRTVWANLVGLAAVALGALGFDTSGLDPSAFAEAAIQLVVASSFIASTVFRIVATRQLLG